MVWKGSWNCHWLFIQLRHWAQLLLYKKILQLANYLFFSFFSFSHSYHLFDLGFPSAGLWHPFKTKEIPLVCSLFCHFQSQNRKQIKCFSEIALQEKKWIFFIIKLCSKDCTMLSANIYQQCLYLNSQGINFCKASYV